MILQRHDNIAFSTPGEIRAVQAGLLQQHVQHCSEHSPFYRDLLRQRGIDGRNVELDNLRQLPVTDKEDLEGANDQFLAVPVERVVDIVQSSGTTGRPTRIMYTSADLDRLAYNEYKSFAAAGLTDADVILLTCTMDRCFIAGLAYFLGLRELGAATIRNGHGTMESHRDLIHRLRPTAIVGVPSFLRKLAVFMQERGETPAAVGVRRLVCIGEPVRDQTLASLPLGQDLANLWAAKVYSTYASSEIITSFCECEAGTGGHLHPDLAVLEILDDQGNAMPDGEIGEVVVTPLQIEGMPLLRFRTGDLSFQRTERCVCGRNTPRLGPILARRKQMIKLKGTTLYPEMIARALDEFGDIGEYYVEVTYADVLSDRVIVHAYPKHAGLTADAVSDFLSSRLRTRPLVVIETEAAIRQVVFSPHSRKPVRFVDRRNP